MSFAPKVMLKNGVSLPVLFCRHEPALTLEQIDEAHQKRAGTARRHFERHQDQFVLGEDFYRPDSPEGFECVAETLRAPVILLPAFGYSLLVKRFRGAEVASIRKQLIKHYFWAYEPRGLSRITLVGKKVRILIDAQSETWFLLRELCTAFDLKAVAKTIQRLRLRKVVVQRTFLDEVGKARSGLFIHADHLKRFMEDFEKRDRARFVGTPPSRLQ